jgi:hypothetical protein
MLRKAAKQIQSLHLSAHPNKNTWNLSVCNDCEKAGQLERTLRPAMTAIPSDADEVGGKVGQPAMAMSNAVANEKAGQPERAPRPAMTAIPSDVGKVHEKAGQPERAQCPAMTAIPSGVKEADTNAA